MKNCPHCGAKIVKYKHALNIPLVESLKKIYRSGPSKIADLDITHAQINNFHKLKYWSLIKQDSPRQYSISNIGILFLKNEIKLPEYAITFRGKTMELTGRLVSVIDIEPSFWCREDYAREAI